MRYFGRPDATDISNSKYILLLPEIKGEAVKSKQFGTQKAVESFKKAFEDYGFEGRIKVVKKAVSSAMVINSKKMVLIKEGAKFSQNEMQYLSEHEIGVHMLTTMNAANNKLKIFSVGLPVNTRTGEGMAVLSEYLSGNFTMKRLRELALRVIAIDMMCNGADFKSCFSHLVEKYKTDKNFAFIFLTFSSSNFASK